MRATEPGRPRLVLPPLPPQRPNIPPPLPPPQHPNALPLLLPPQLPSVRPPVSPLSPQRPSVRPPLPPFHHPNVMPNPLSSRRASEPASPRLVLPPHAPPHHPNGLPPLPPARQPSVLADRFSSPRASEVARPRLVLPPPPQNPNALQPPRQPNLLANRFRSFRAHKPARAHPVLPPLTPPLATTPAPPPQWKTEAATLPFELADLREAWRLQQEYDAKHTRDLREALRLQQEYDREHAGNLRGQAVATEATITVQIKEAVRRTQPEENDDRKCCVCLDQEKCMLLRPCRHVPVCSSCSSQLVVCPICRTQIRETEKIFI